jgi:hypothetical protein
VGDGVLNRAAVPPATGPGLDEPAKATGDRLLGAGVVSAVIAGFILSAWHVEPFRQLFAPLARALPVLLYVAAALAVVGSQVLSRAERPAASAPDGLRHGWARLRAAAGLSGSVTACLVPVFAAWETGRQPFAVAGVLPFSDASLNYGGAQRLLFLGAADEWAARRPMNPAFLAVRLAVTGLDLRKALLIGGVLLGIACFLAASVVARDLGAAAGIAVFAGIYGFAFPTSGMTMSEGLGVTFGALALAALWVAARDGSLALGLGGLALLTVGQGVRSGMILVLPALVLWLARRHRPDGAWLSWRALGMSVVAVVVGGLVSLGAALAVNAEVKSVNGDGGYLLYGLANGRSAWNQARGNWDLIFADHPEITTFDEAERNRFINEKAIAAVARRPVTFAKTLAASGVNYLLLARKFLLAPVPGRAFRVGATVAGLATVAALVAFRRRYGARWAAGDVAILAGAVLALPLLLDPWSQRVFPTWTALVLGAAALCAFAVARGGPPSPRQRTFVLAALAGCAATLPLIGAEYLDSRRTVGATIPFLALPLGFAAAVLAGPAGAASGEPSGSSRRDHQRRGWSAVAVGGGVVAVTLVGAPVAAALVDRPSVAARPCPDGGPAQAFFGGVATHVVSRDAEANRLDELASAAVLATAPTLAYPPEDPDATLPRTILSAITQEGNDRIAYVRGVVSASGTSVLYLCGRDTQDPISIAFTHYFWPKPVTFAFFVGSPLPGTSRP